MLFGAEALTITSNFKAIKLPNQSDNEVKSRIKQAIDTSPIFRIGILEKVFTLQN